MVTATTVPVNQWSIFRIEVEDSNRVARFYINGTLVATHTGTTIPASAIRFGHQIGLLITNTTANTMDIDYIRMWSDDPADNGKKKAVTTQNVIIDNSTPPEYTGSSILPSFIYTSKQYLGDLSFILNKMGNTDSGAIQSATTLRDDDMTIDEYGNYILNSMKQSLEKLSGVKINTNLSVEGVTTKTLTTDSLCVGEQCFTSDQIANALSGTGRASNNNGEVVQNVYNSYTTVVSQT